MESFEGKVAVLTGGGTGMGRELVRKLAAAGCHVAACDVLDDNLAETLEITRRESPDVTVTGHHCDVGVESEIEQFALEVARDHATDHINLLFNNAGIGGGGSFVQLPRAQWDRTFNICWGGVYWTTRAFLPMLMASDEGHVVNTSSVNGFLGIARRWHLTHGIFGGQICRQRVQRIADHRLPLKCASPRGVCGHARSHRHVHRDKQSAHYVWRQQHGCFR